MDDGVHLPPFARAIGSPWTPSRPFFNTARSVSVIFGHQPRWGAAAADLLLLIAAVARRGSCLMIMTCARRGDFVQDEAHVRQAEKSLTPPDPRQNMIEWWLLSIPTTSGRGCEAVNQ